MWFGHMKIIFSTLVFLLLSVLFAYNAGITVSNPFGFAGKRVVGAGIPLPSGVCRDTENWLPINPEERILVIEQKVKDYNNIKWHSGILFEGCLKYSRNVDYLETAYTWDAKDRENIAKEIADYDTIVVTNYFIRGKLCNKEAIEEIIASGKKVIVVTNTPYEEVSIPKNAKSVVVTFATSPDNIEVVAGTLYGKITPEGVWPVAYHA